MKKIFLLTLVIFNYLVVTAQIGEVKEVNGDMSKGKNRGFKVLIPEVNEKQAIKSWERLMKEYDAKTDKVKKSDDYKSESAKIPSISEKEIDVYAVFNETPEGVFLNTYFDLGGAFLNSDMHSELAPVAMDFVKKFASDLAIETISEKLKNEEKEFDKLSKEQKSLEKDKEGYEEDIKKAKETIEERNKDLKENAEDQTKKKKELTEQGKVVDELKSKLDKFK